MGETVARRPGLPKFLGDRVIHLRRPLLCHSPGLMGAGLALLRQFYAAEMFSCRVPGMMRQPPLERRARHPMQSCPSVLWPCFEQSSPYPEPTLMSHGVFFPLRGQRAPSLTGALSFRVPVRTLARLGTKPTTSSRFLPEIFASCPTAYVRQRHLCARQATDKCVSWDKNLLQKEVSQ